MSSHLGLAMAYDGALVVICCFALLRGERPERIGAVVNIIGSGATVLLRYLHVAQDTPAEISIMAIDAGVLACLFWLAIKTVRFWPVWAFGFALADIFVSAAGALIPKTPLFAYQTSLGIYAYLALGALALGTLRLQRHGSPDDHQGFRRPLTSPASEES